MPGPRSWPPTRGGGSGMTTIREGAGWLGLSMSKIREREYNMRKTKGRMVERYVVALNRQGCMMRKALGRIEGRYEVALDRQEHRLMEERLRGVPGQNGVHHEEGPGQDGGEVRGGPGQTDDGRTSCCIHPRWAPVLLAKTGVQS